MANQTKPPMTSADKDQFAQKLLNQLGAPVTPVNMAFLRSWMDQEGSKADYNPMATTGRYGQATGADFNGAGVRNFETMEGGVAAQARTLQNGHYPTLLAGLRNGTPYLAANGAEETKTYTGSGSYYAGIVQGAAKRTGDPAVIAAAATCPRTAGSLTGAGGASPTQRSVDVGPDGGDAAKNRTIPLSFDVSAMVPTTPTTVVQEGLDLASWYEADPTQPGGYVGNPHLRGVATPASFELRLNRADGVSLAGSDGSPIQIRLNVSLQNISTKSQHIVSREPTATGLMITHWGSQPDVIVGRGTTGVFVNQFGLAALMSNKLTAQSCAWASLITAAMVGKAASRQSLLGAGNSKQNVFRVAAQDAFAEMLALFKNNGVTRFLPMPSSALEAVQKSDWGSKGLTDAQNALDNTSVWSPAAGATGFQMNARAGDIYTRGYVVFRYKGRTHLGYFKSLNFSANAATPFKWDFDFTFRVLKSFSPMFQPGGGA